MQGLQGKPVPVGGNARFLRVMEQYSKASAAVREAEIAVAAGADEKILYDALGELTLLNETVADENEYFEKENENPSQIAQESQEGL